MGKTTKPLHILVDEDLATSQQILDLQEQGHTIEYDNLSIYDLILSKRAWRCTPELVKNIKHAIKGARELVYDKGTTIGTTQGSKPKLARGKGTQQEVARKGVQSQQQVHSTTGGDSSPKGRTKPSKKAPRKGDQQEQLSLYPESLDDE